MLNAEIRSCHQGSSWWSWPFWEWPACLSATVADPVLAPSRLENFREAILWMIQAQTFMSSELKVLFINFILCFIWTSFWDSDLKIQYIGWSRKSYFICTLLSVRFQPQLPCSTLPTFLSGILRSCHSTNLELGTVHIFGHVTNCSNLSRQYISKCYCISYITNRLEALFLISKTFHPHQPRSRFQYSSERNPESENRKDLSDRTR